MDGFVIAEPEKALVDSLAYRPLRGIQEYAKCLTNAWTGLDKEKFTEYLLKFKNKSIVSRAGYLIEHMGLNYEQIGSLLNPRSPGFVRLDTEAKKSGPYDKKWNVIINVDVEREEIK